MKDKKNRPTRPEPMQGEINFPGPNLVSIAGDEDTPKLYGKQAKAVELLRSGKFSTHDNNPPKSLKEILSGPEFKQIRLKKPQDGHI